MTTAAPESAELTALWDQQFTVDNDNSLAIEIGDLSLCARSQPMEWQLFYHWEKRGIQGNFLCRPQPLPGSNELPNDRIAMDHITPQLRLLPRLADRPVVVRPYAPLTLAANCHLTLYVSTPVWLQLELSGRVLRELPVQQLSDTWMGNLTGEGQLCYGSHTHARLDRSQLLSLPYRVLTPVRIHNKSHQERKLERLSLPTPYLSVFASSQSLTTEALKITMDAEKGQGVVKIGRPPDNARLLSAPRLSADKGILVSAWSNLFA
ncbi:hypothetical protein [Pseudomaricurvus sp. HS19]|uniref:hypothetical protein n=1 Tax=Pseudomaricurvus sp. HS19 TaxID=2692626 RepID=UPI0013711DD6|nr:hypothetical protein [Pseudomaricurvus sp. HS19]MYM64540.1 hypothetical protein [Pseudomaricurvus sp. HS19]